ncbi:integral membrane protein [Aspergillus avenaceus]|uniref:Integral membrane protein n=1 Tax=Aspergillus avenaceus TaxID=36643 RepID=A0A5N6U320_ASPAV|nr:integral membrane protein [Aspergillus avenaceus]
MGWVYNATPEVEALSRYPTILGVCFALTGLMMIVVSLRVYIRFRAGRMAADDYVMIVTMHQSRYGLGLPLALRPKANLNQYMKINFAGRPFYQMGIAGFKAALCLSYLRLLSGTSRKMYKILIWAVLIISTLGHAAGTLILILNCKPVRKSWEPTVEGTCLPFGSTNYALVGWTIFCDLVVIFLPVPLLLKLNVKTAQKAGLLCLFLLGLFTTICSIMRLTQISVIAYGDGNSTMLVLWGTVEFNVGNIVTCMPFLGPLLKGYVRDFRSRSGSKGKYPTGSHYALQSYSKDTRQQSTVTSGNFTPRPKRTPSEELILDSGSDTTTNGAIKMTVEYRVSVDKKSDMNR